MQKTLKTFFDFCSGIGSAHLAFKKLDLECVGYSEIDEKAIKTYKLFYGTKYKNYGDLMKINPEHLNDFDILVAGFPCQAFSILGYRKGFDDDRGKIIHGLSRIIETKKPKAFLLENVKGLLSINNGNTMQFILEILKNCGYQVFYKVLKSSDFGIPQKRERIYFVGIRNDLYEKDKQFEFPEKENNKLPTLKDFLIEENDEFVVSGTQYDVFLNYLNNKYNVGKYHIDDLLKLEYLVIDGRQSDLRIYRDCIPTLRTGRQGIMYIKNRKLRKISGLEALLLQGFNIDLARKAQENIPKTMILSQAGNAMTVDVMEKIGKSILDYMNG
jgi:DNA (cytosine-5)-methyltransferase 1